MAAVRTFSLAFFSVKIYNELLELGVIRLLQRYNIKICTLLFMSVTTNMATLRSF